MDVAVYDFIRAVAEDDLDSLPERFDSPRTPGYSTSGGMVDDIVDVLEGYKQQIVDGEIEVSATPSN